MSINAGVKLLAASGSEGWSNPYNTGIRIEVHYPSGSGQTSSTNPISVGDIVIDQLAQVWSVGSAVLSGVNIFTCSLKWLEGTPTSDTIPDIGGTSYGLVITPKVDGRLATFWDATYISDAVARKALQWSTTVSNMSDIKVALNSADTTAGYLLDKIIAGTNITLVQSVDNGVAKVKINSSGSASGGNGKIGITSTDATNDYLLNKVQAGQNISFDLVTNSGGGQSLRINSISGAAGANDAVRVTATDSSPNYLSKKLVAGPGITFDVLNSGSNESYRINSSFAMTPVLSTSVYYADSMDRIITDTNVSDFQSGEVYNKGDKCLRDNRIYFCDVDKFSGDWDATKWKIKERPKSWTPGATYIKGELVYLEGAYYECNIASSTATVFSVSDWKLIPLWTANSNYYNGTLVVYETNVYELTNGYVSGTYFLSSDWTVVNEWMSGTPYRHDDRVAHNGNVYKLLKGFVSGKTFSESNWYAIPAWQTNTKYKNSDVVFYYDNTNYKVYSFISGYVSGLSFDAAAFKSIPAWAANTSYVMGDLISYDDDVYACTAGFVSGDVFNLSNWSTIPAWAANTNYYNGDLVYVDTNLYKCIAGYVTTTPFVLDDWTAIMQWQANKTYARGTYVYYNGQVYKSKAIIPNTETSFNTAEWYGPYEARVWEAGQTYKTGEACYYNGYYYVLKSTAGYMSSDVFNGTDWQLQTTPADYVSNYNYKNGDIIYHSVDGTSNKSFYMCASGYKSGTAFDSTNWEQRTIDAIWNTDTEYGYGDIVEYNHNYYVCKSGYISTNIFDATKWSEVATVAGWQVNQPYVQGDYVQFAGQVYLCTRGFTGESTFGKKNWTAIDEWAPNTEYDKTDQVSYNNKLYQCAEGYTSGTEFNAAYWTQIPGFQANHDYYAGDTIYSNGNIYTCKGFVTDTVFVLDNWTHIKAYTWIDGFNDYFDASSSSTGVASLMYYNGTVYRCIASHTATTQTPNFTCWEQVSVKGNWLPNTTYIRGEVVVYQGEFYSCDAGFRSGNSFSANDWNLYVANVPIYDMYTEYKRGDIVRAGASSTAYFICTYGYTSGTVFDVGSWQELTNYADWKPDTSYINDEIVRYDGRFYICTNGYVSGATFTDADWSVIDSSGVWESGKSYINGEIVTYKTTTYVCKSGYVSGSAFNPNDWDILDAHVVVLPSSPNFGDTVIIIDGGQSWSVWSLRLVRNGHKIMNVAKDMECNVSQSFTLLYSGVNLGWIIY